MDGFFPITTQTIATTSTSTRIEPEHDWPASTSAYTLTETQFSCSMIRMLPRPTCHLPKTLNQCQSQWDAYVPINLAPAPTRPPHCDVDDGPWNGRSLPSCAIPYDSAIESWSSYVSQVTSPGCTQASIGGALCGSVIDKYDRQGNQVFQPSVAVTAPYFSAG